MIITLKSGRSIDPNAGIVGINDKLNVYEGYDSELMPRIDKPDWMDDDDWDAATKLTPVEQIELADILIERWQRFRTRAVAAADQEGKAV